jgi:hypothetical protein
LFRKGPVTRSRHGLVMIQTDVTMQAEDKKRPNVGVSVYLSVYVLEFG